MVKFYKSPYMKRRHYYINNPIRILISAIILAIVFLAPGILSRLQKDGFHKAILEMPGVYKRHIEKFGQAKLREIEKYKVSLVKLFPFSQESALKEWEEKVFKGRVVYEVEKDKSIDYVRATSKASASALYYKIELNAKTKNPIISWKWNVEEFPVKKHKESLETEDESDFAARVYVIFPANFILNYKVLEYIWTENVPAGETGTSPYSKNIKIIVVRSGPNPDKKWFSEERDIVADYIKVFGRKPEKNVGAVAFMTNAEHTGTSAVSMYDDIRLGYKEDGMKNGQYQGGKELEKTDKKEETVIGR
jgi:hypothetical protein